MKRQYVLPSCSLTLEGIGTGAAQEMSILANAECRFMGIEPPLNGGLEFFRALVETVSQYAQGMLSNLPRPTSPEKLVRLIPGEGDASHRLLVAARPEVDPALQEETELKLSTVQLFDLTDAIDQFLADTQTLPDLALQVRSRPRREVKSDEPVAERVLPPIIGVGALAAAAAGLFMLPIPEVPEFDPESIPRSSQPGLEAPVPGIDGSDGLEGDEPDTSSGDNESDANDAPSSSTEPDTRRVVVGNEAEELAAPALSTAALSQLQAQLEDQINDSLPADAAFDAPLIYEVSVAENGDIVNYQAANQVALNEVDNTPLPTLTYVPLDAAETDAAAQFSVRFEPDGSVDVAPWSNTVIDDLDAGVESEADEDVSE